MDSLPLFTAGPSQHSSPLAGGDVADNWFVTLSAYAFKNQLHETISGRQEGLVWPRLEPCFLRMGYSACPLSKTDFLRVELAYDVQRGQVIEVQGAQTHPAFAHLQAVLIAHLGQLMDYRTALLSIIRPAVEGSAEAYQQMLQKAQLQQICNSIRYTFQAKQVEEIPCMVRAYKLALDQSLEQAAHAPDLEHALHRLKVITMGVYFEVINNAPVYVCDFSGGLGLRDLHWLEPMAIAHLQAVLGESSGTREQVLSATGMRGHLRVRLTPTGYKTTLALRSCEFFPCGRPNSQPDRGGRLHGFHSQRECGLQVGGVLNFPLDVRRHFEQLRNLAGVGSLNSMDNCHA